MSDQPQIYGLSALVDWDFTKASMEEFDPNAAGFRNPAPGTYKCLVLASPEPQVVLGHQWNVRETVDGVDQTVQYILGQIRPTLEVISGPESGARIMDFLPLPTPGVRMPTQLANRWANFCRGIGMPLPPGASFPTGKKLSDIQGKACMVTIVQSMRNGQVQLRDDGLPRMQVKMFGYAPVVNESAPTPAGSETGPKTSSASKRGTAQANSVQQAPQSQPAKPAFDL